MTYLEVSGEAFHDKSDGEPARFNHSLVDEVKQSPAALLPLQLGCQRGKSLRQAP